MVVDELPSRLSLVEPSGYMESSRSTLDGGTVTSHSKYTIYTPGHDIRKYM